MAIIGGVAGGGVLGVGFWFARERDRLGDRALFNVKPNEAGLSGWVKITRDNRVIVAVPRAVDAPVFSTPEPIEPVGFGQSPPLAVPVRADSLELTFVGDVVLGRYLDHRGDEVFVEMHPAADDPFAAVTSLLDADVVVGNLESPIARALPARPPVVHRNCFAGSDLHLGQLVLPERPHLRRRLQPA